MKIRPVGAELFCVDGQTDRHGEAITVAFRNFANVPKKSPVPSGILTPDCRGRSLDPMLTELYWLPHRHGECHNNL
jgi:hypothetical protein